MFKASNGGLLGKLSGILLGVAVLSSSSKRMIQLG